VAGAEGARKKAGMKKLGHATLKGARVKNWRTYQDAVAALFRDLGYSVEIEKEIAGARATHKIDVWVEFKSVEIEQRWVLECKYWGAKIPKEKVLALRALVEDIGADRAILISDAGFQSGAIRAAAQTNISLLTFSQLEEFAKIERARRTFHKIEQEVNKLRRRIAEYENRYTHPITGLCDHWIEIGGIKADLDTIEKSLPLANAGKFPFTMCTRNESCETNDLGQFVKQSTDLLVQVQRILVQVLKWP
jgi:hypothetical protein